MENQWITHLEKSFRLLNNWPFLILANAPVGLVLGAYFGREEFPPEDPTVSPLYPMLGGILFWVTLLSFLDWTIMKRNFLDFSRALRLAAIGRLLFMGLILPDMILGLLSLKLARQVLELPAITYLFSEWFVDLNLGGLFLSTTIMGFLLLLEILLFSLPITGFLRYLRFKGEERDYCSTQ